jgi:peptidoglycan/LPS O-acetylase OafA/YrhL
LGAFWLTAWRSKLEELFKKYSLIIFPVGFVLVLVPFLISFGQGFQALGFVVLLLHSVVSPNGTFYRILNFKWMNQIGILSYSIYIWHQPIWMMWPKLLGAVWFLWIPVLLGVSCISYEYLEKPFFALRSKYRDPNSNLLR